ncbi:unnamed protein product [Brassica oleracea]|uniref:Uncharacterized protein n=1 Tax=Brassica oleracea TaxID=3712 RepID=A0A3P6BEA3_BRAOL|nr:unnamed protein product [Brassica oleracea]
MLIDFVPTESGVSLAEAPGFSPRWTIRLRRKTRRRRVRPHVGWDPEEKRRR